MNIGGYISDMNHKAHLNPIYNAFQYAVVRIAVFSGGYVKTAAYVFSADPDTIQTEYKWVLETYICKVDRLVHLIMGWRVL